MTTHVIAILSALCLSAADPVAGLSGPVGAPRNARVVRELRIDRAGIYENIVVEIYTRNVLIENCRIHHVLAGTFRDQRDAHGITGRPRDLTIRNCEIAHVSGDAVQFDPSRKIKPYPWDNVLIERCFFWTGPLPGGAGEGFMDIGTRPAPALARWPYNRVPVGRVISSKNTPRARDEALPTRPATGWNAKASGERPDHFGVARTGSFSGRACSSCSSACTRAVSLRRRTCFGKEDTCQIAPRRPRD